MKTIAIFSAYTLPHLGGIERYIDNLSKQLVKKGYKIIIITSNYLKLQSDQTIDNIRYLRLPTYNIFSKRYPILKHNSAFYKILKKLDEYNIDTIIVNTRFHLTSHVGASYGKKNNIPVYLIEHGSNYVTLDNKLIDFFANRYEDFLTFKIKNKITGYYGVSDACSNWLKNFNIKASGTWYNSIDCEQKLPQKVKHNGINFLYAGRLIKQKGVENILEAFSKLEAQNKNIHLYIAGDGPQLNELKKLYKSKNINFLGKLDFKTLLNYYAKADVFLYPPLWPEGLPTSILEAGLMKCACIGTRKGGILEILNKNNGILIKDNLDELYKAMNKLIKNPELIKVYSSRLNKTIKEKFSWDVTSDKIIKDTINKK